MLAELTLNIVLVRVRIGAGSPDSQLQKTLKFFNFHLINFLFEHLFSPIDKMREPVSPVHKEIVLHALQSVN